MDTRGQGAIEYLLIIGAAILIVAIVILAVTGILGGGQGQTDQAKIDQEKASGGLSCQATNCTWVGPSGKVDCCGFDNNQVANNVSGCDGNKTTPCTKK
jgi:hypothetical protein